MNIYHFYFFRARISNICLYFFEKISNVCLFLYKTKEFSLNRIKFHTFQPKIIYIAQKRKEKAYKEDQLKAQFVQNVPNETKLDWSSPECYTDMAKKEQSNNKYYTSTFHIYIYIRKANTEKYFWLKRSIVYDKLTRCNVFYRRNINYCISLVRWSLHKYKCLWGVGGGGVRADVQVSKMELYTHIRLD